MSQLSQSLRKSLKKDIIQDILQNKIGFGSAQYTLGRPLNLLLFSQGCQSIVLGLLLPQLGQQWKMGVYQKSLLITLVYIGVIIGSYLQTYADIYGRYMFITWNAVLQCIFGLASCLAFSFQSFLVCRFFYGVGIGIVLPLSGTYFVEITPSKNRASFLSLSRVYWSFGCLTSTLAGWLLLRNNHWRILLLLLCLPGLYALIEHKINGKQSLRFLWAKKDVKSVKQMLDYMAQKNNSTSISLDELQRLIRGQSHAVQQILGEEQNHSSIKDLFNQKYKLLTLFLSAGWFSVCFIYYGVLLLLPSLLEKNPNFNLNFRYFVIGCLSLTEIISFWGVSYVMDHQKIGRRKCIYFGFLFVAFFVFCLLIIDKDSRIILLILFILIKLLITGTFMTLYPYTSQIYETFYRGKAMGLTSCLGRIGTAFLGITGVSSLQWFGGNGLYYLFIGFSLISSFLVYKIPFDTLNRPIDV